MEPVLSRGERLLPIYAQSRLGLAQWIPKNLTGHSGHCDTRTTIVWRLKSKM